MAIVVLVGESERSSGETDLVGSGLEHSVPTARWKLSLAMMEYIPPLGRRQQEAMVTIVDGSLGRLAWAQDGGSRKGGIFIAHRGV